MLLSEANFEISAREKEKDEEGLKGKEATIYGTVRPF